MRDIGCATGHLLVTLPLWAEERGLRIEPFGLELLPPVAELARSLHPGLAHRIWTGSSCYTSNDHSPRPLFEDLTAAGHRPDGVIRIDRPGRPPLLAAWLDAPGRRSVE